MQYICNVTNTLNFTNFILMSSYCWTFLIINFKITDNVFSWNCLLFITVFCCCVTSHFKYIQIFRKLCTFLIDGTIFLDTRTNNASNNFNHDSLSCTSKATNKTRSWVVPEHFVFIQLVCLDDNNMHTKYEASSSSGSVIIQVYIQNSKSIPFRNL